MFFELILHGVSLEYYEQNHESNKDRFLKRDLLKYNYPYSKLV